MTNPFGHPCSGRPQLLLASASPRRRQLLAEAGVAFQVVPAAIEEWEHPEADPEALVRHNAQAKAGALSRRYPDLPVLAADTTVALQNEVLNKPSDYAEARAMLRKLSGRTHQVFTAVAFFWEVRNWRECRCVTSRVTFRPLDEAIIDAYFRLVDPLDKAGAYGIQEGRELIIDHWEGSLSNIMGLPMETVRLILEPWGLLPVPSC